MRKEKKVSEQSNPISESTYEKIRVANGGTIRGAEGGLRADMFEHDDITDEDNLPCICDLPDHAQEILYDEIEQQENDILDA
jgi:hypothetical protein